MNRNVAAYTLSLLIVVAGCGSGSGSGAGASIAATAAGPVTAVAPATTVAATTPAVTIPGSTLPSVPSITPSIPTVAPSPYYFPGCRNVETLYDPTGTRRDYDVRRGDCGVGVYEVQVYLNAKLGHVIAEDGQFGPGTEAAVRDFQLLVDLPVTGVVDTITFVALASDDYDPGDA